MLAISDLLKIKTFRFFDWFSLNERYRAVSIELSFFETEHKSCSFVSF